MKKNSATFRQWMSHIHCINLLATPHIVDQEVIEWILDTVPGKRYRFWLYLKPDFFGWQSTRLVMVTAMTFAVERTRFISSPINRPTSNSSNVTWFWARNAHQIDEIFHLSPVTLPLIFTAAQEEFTLKIQQLHFQLIDEKSWKSLESCLHIWLA